MKHWANILTVDWLVDVISSPNLTTPPHILFSYPLGKPMIEVLISFVIGGIAGALWSEYTHPCRDCFQADDEFTGEQL